MPQDAITPEQHLAAGRWQQARAGFEAQLQEQDSAEARFGLANALWWLGENHDSVAECTLAYAAFRRRGQVADAARCAVWLGITYKANFANQAVANGWIARAERLLDGVDAGPQLAWAWVARAYQMADLDQAEALTDQALQVARAHGDVDLELVALSQLGLIRVGQGQPSGGFAMLDEALAAALAGERSTLDTVAYACCDMLNACELAGDIERAGQWCQVADGFADEYGCPFLYAECRIYYGSLLSSTGRWADAERELGVAARITEQVCPSLHAMALTRLADLRTRQGRLEDADRLLAEAASGVPEETEISLQRAALLLARGDPAAAAASVEWRTRTPTFSPAHLSLALDLLVSAYLEMGDSGAAAELVGRLDQLVDASPTGQARARVSLARGRLTLASADLATAARHLDEAVGAWTRLGFPLEAARSRLDLARALAPTEPDAGALQARQALAAFEHLGASIDADRAAAFLRSLGIRARTGAKGVGTLTNREQEVLALLAAGHSNPQIAQRLHLSRKTVSHHVSSILLKLEVRNRSEAVAYAVAANADPGDRHT